MRKKIMMFALFCISATLIGCGNKIKESNEEIIEVEPLIINTKEDVKENLNEESIVDIELDFIDEEYLLKIAQYKGGDLEDRIYTIFVTLNKAQEKEESDMYSEYATSMVQDTVLRELYQIEGITPYDFEAIIPDELTKEAMQIIKCKKIGMKYKD